jgi:hypothetical protein
LALHLSVVVVTQNYKLCVSCPKMFVVPMSVKDEDLLNAAPLHHKGTCIPLAHRTSGPSS